MNKHFLLAGWLSAILTGTTLCASAQQASTFTIEQLFEIADSQSVHLRPYLTAVKESELDVKVAKSNRLPDIDANLSISFLGDGFTTGRDFSDYQKATIPHLGNGLSVGVHQPVFAGGAITKEIELSKLKADASSTSLEMERGHLRFRIASLYLDLYKALNFKNVVDNNITLAKRVLNEMEARHQQGVALKNDIIRYELLLSDLELNKIQLNNSISILNNSLTTIVGLPEGSTIIPDTTTLHRHLPAFGVDWWQEEAKINSPAVKLAKTGIDISHKNEDLEKTSRLPKITLNAGWTIDGPILVEVPPINRNLSYWFVGVGVDYNLSSLYKSKKKLAAIHQNNIRSEEQLDVTLRNLNLEVQNDYIRYLETYEDLKTREKGVQLAELNYHTTSTRYAEGMALITEMIDAANSLIDAQRQVIEARISIVNYYYKLLYTSGKL